MLPTNADRKPNPTHQITQTATGVMFLKVFGIAEQAGSNEQCQRDDRKICKLATTSGTRTAQDRWSGTSTACRCFARIARG